MMKPITFETVTVKGGAAGGISRKCSVNLHIEGESDTVCGVADLVKAAPETLKVIGSAAR